MAHLKTFSIACALSFIAHTTVFSAQTCEKFKIATNGNWPPYSFKQANFDVGLGHKIATAILKELDIPYEFVDYDPDVEVQKKTRFHQVDFIVASYRRKDLEDSLRYVYPPYAQDAIAIAIKTDKKVVSSDWKTLAGIIGGKDFIYAYDEDFLRHRAPYLFIRPEVSTSDVLRFLKEQKIEYGVGSKNQLKYLVNKMELGGKVKILSDQGFQDGVYFAFNTDSPCQVYGPYFKRRIEDWQANGTIKSWLTNYMPEIMPPLEAPVEKIPEKPSGKQKQTPSKGWEGLG